MPNSVSPISPGPIGSEPAHIGEEKTLLKNGSIDRQGAIHSVTSLRYQVLITKNQLQNIPGAEKKPLEISQLMRQVKAPTDSHQMAKEIVSLCGYQEQEILAKEVGQEIAKIKDETIQNFCLMQLARFSLPPYSPEEIVFDLAMEMKKQVSNSMWADFSTLLPPPVAFAKYMAGLFAKPEVFNQFKSQVLEMKR